MEVERNDGSRYSRQYDNKKDLLADLDEALDDPQIKQITIKPQLRIPKKRGRK